MASCVLTLDIGYGPDVIPRVGEIDVYRLNEAVDADSDFLVLPVKQTVSIIKNGDFAELTLEQGVTYLFDVRRLDSTHVTAGVRAKTMPATATANFSDVPDVTPLYPAAGILGDDLIDGVISDPASDSYATLLQFVIDHPGPTGATGTAGTPGAPGAAGGTDAATASWIASGTLTPAALAARADWINVKDFGATGNGSTDDTAAINSALAAVDHTKKRTTVYFPPGTYMVNGVGTPGAANGASRGIDGGIKPSSGTTLELDRSAILRCKPTSSAGYAVVYVGPDVDDVTIRGGQIQGERDVHDWTTEPHATSEFGYGIYSRGAQNLTVDGVSISKCLGDCILASSVGSVDDLDPTYNPSSGRIVNCYLDGARRNNISLIASDHYVIENNTISRAGYNDGNHDGTAPRAGIDLEFSSNQAVKGTVIRGNRFTGNVLASVENFNGRGVVIESNFMDSPVIVAAHINNDTIIKGNVVANQLDTTNTGIQQSGGSTGLNTVVIEGNIVLGFKAGIQLSGQGVTCSGNYVSQFTTSGILTYLVTDASIIGNHISDGIVGTNTTAIDHTSPYTITTPGRIECIGNRISGVHFGMQLRQGAVGVIAKGNLIRRSFTALNVGTGSQVVFEANQVDLPGHPDGQGSDVVYSSTASVVSIGNTFRNSSTYTFAATSGGTGGLSRIIQNKILESTSTIAVNAIAGTHDIIDNTFSVKLATGALYAIQITGAATNCKVFGNTAYATDVSPYTRLVKSDAATGSPATTIMGNTFVGAIVATPHATDIVGDNFTSGRLTAKRVVSAASTATLTVNVDLYDAAKLTAQAAALAIAAPTGTPVPMQPLFLRLKDNGTARAITRDAIFRAVGVTLPTTTVAGKTLYEGYLWNSDASKWDCIAVAQEA